MKASKFKIAIPENEKCAVALLTMLKTLGYTAYSLESTILEEVKALKRDRWNFLYINASGKYVGCREGYSLRAGSIEELLGMAGKEENVKLNDTYTATVTEDGIEVGCQTFTFEAFDKLAEAVKKIRG